MSKRQPTPGVHENFASVAETSFGLDHGDELVAGHPPRLASTELTNEGHQPNLAADLNGEVGSLEHDGSPFPDENSTSADGNLTEGNHRVCTWRTPPPQSHVHLMGIETAPKDGTWFIAYQNGEPFPCDWRTEEQDEGPPREGWFDFFNRSFEDPTHWLPVWGATTEGSADANS